MSDIEMPLLKFLLLNDRKAYQQERSMKEAEIEAKNKRKMKKYADYR